MWKVLGTTAKELNKTPARDFESDYTLVDASSVRIMDNEAKKHLLSFLLALCVILLCIHCMLQSITG
jgi:hypothetical protein